MRPFLRHVFPFAFALTAAVTTTACGASSSSDGAPAGDAVEGDVQEFGTGPKLAYDEYTVLFTNPLCKKYDYPADQVGSVAVRFPMTSPPSTGRLQRASLPRKERN